MNLNWFNFNAKEIERLVPKVVELDKKVSNIEKDIDNLKSNCGELKQDIKEIRGARITDYLVAFSALAGLTGVMAKGFGWL